MAENRSLVHETVVVLFLPARESWTVISMQEGRRVSQSESGMTVGGLLGGGEEDTRISINAEPKFPESVSVLQYMMLFDSSLGGLRNSHVVAYLFLRYECVPSC